MKYLNPAFTAKIQLPLVTEIILLRQIIIRFSEAYKPKLSYSFIFCTTLAIIASEMNSDDT